ncbi:putative NADPH-quinone reductase [Rhizomicrobium palustre]|uniref:Putative NADPH-quinone reductase n=1 Tax=Rhizomicrobium palustre TaxID=189966 RepID=A0A846MUQ2_9PROT|nr:NAD(P)H-dependent oxidoreductase [Rhizomicrobium palustre]NIK86842.1 putative NADPH-quinone reductase [Rhizomicrobium palustre]
MASKRIFLLDGHPDPSPERLCAGLTDAYAAGALRSGHEVRRFDLGTMTVPLMRTKGQFETGMARGDAAHVQDAIVWADHVVIIHPLWMGNVPAMLKALMEQVFRNDFVLTDPADKTSPKKLKGKTAHLAVTMGMPSLLYRWYYSACAVRAVENNLLAFSGIRPIKRTLIGGVETMSDEDCQHWFAKMQQAGARAR